MKEEAQEESFEKWKKEKLLRWGFLRGNYKWKQKRKLVTLGNKWAGYGNQLQFNKQQQSAGGASRENECALWKLHHKGYNVHLVNCSGADREKQTRAELKKFKFPSTSINFTRQHCGSGASSSFATTKASMSFLMTRKKFCKSAWRMTCGSMQSAPGWRDMNGSMVSPEMLWMTPGWDDAHETTS